MAIDAHGGPLQAWRKRRAAAVAVLLDPVTESDLRRWVREAIDREIASVALPPELLEPTGPGGLWGEP